MANPRQRRKAKSLTHRAISHSKRAKRLQKKMPAIRGPKSLQDAWDPTKTVRQNYLALGLEHDLDPIPSGGPEVHPGRTAERTDTRPIDRSASALPKGFGRIVRDASGGVAGVELPSDREEEGSEREPEVRRWARGRVETDTTTVRDLERLAASAAVRARHTSLGERSYLARLVGAHGDDLCGMARDRRLNLGQRTAGELRRALARAGRTASPFAGPTAHFGEIA